INHVFVENPPPPHKWDDEGKPYDYEVPDRYDIEDEGGEKDPRTFAESEVLVCGYMNKECQQLADAQCCTTWWRQKHDEANAKLAEYEEHTGTLGRSINLLKENNRLKDKLANLDAKPTTQDEGEKDIRMKYQGIVYQICQLFDKHIPGRRSGHTSHMTIDDVVGAVADLKEKRFAYEQDLISLREKSGDKIASLQAKNKRLGEAGIRHADQIHNLEDGLTEKDKRIEELELEMDGLRRFKRGVDEALNSGDGTYRP
ncbi:unnamed protein product, partial [marine sediment metagenome]